MEKLPLFTPKDINKYFYNRKEDLNKLNFYLSSLNNNISQRLLITGIRGIGKTFILQKILKDSPENFITCYLDISQVYAENFGKLTEETLLIELLDTMAGAIKNKGKFNNLDENLTLFIEKLRLNDYDFSNTGNLFGVPVPNTDKNSRKLSKFVMEFPQKFVDNHDEINGFIIILDEFQILKNLEVPDSFFWLIRSFNLFQSNVSYVLSGSVSNTAEIIEMLNGSTGAFGGRMIQIDIKPFSKNEVKSYLNDRMSELKFTEEGFNKFYDCTRGIPMYINSFCNVLMPNITYDENLIKETFQVNMDQIMVMWIRVWGSLNKYEKEILIALLPDAKKSWTEILKTIGFSSKTLNKYLNTLQNKGILDYADKNYYFIDVMLRRYLELEKKNKGVYPY